MVGCSYLSSYLRLLLPGHTSQLDDRPKHLTRLGAIPCSQPAGQPASQASRQAGGQAGGQAGEKAGGQAERPGAPSGKEYHERAAQHRCRQQHSRNASTEIGCTVDRI